MTLAPANRRRLAERWQGSGRVLAGESGTGARLFGGDEVHAALVVKDASAVGAGGDFVHALAGEDGLGGELHVAAAAGAVFDADDDALALALEEAFVAVEGAGFDVAGLADAVDFEFGDLLFEVGFEVGEVGDHLVHVLLLVLGDGGGGGDIFGDLFGLLHQFELLVFELGDNAFAGFDFVGEGLVFLVFLGLKLREGVFGDEGLLGLDLEFEAFAFALDLFALGFDGIEPGLGVGGLGLEVLALGGDAGQFGAGADELAVAVLEDEEFFDDGKHVDLVRSLKKRYAPVRIKSTHPQPDRAMSEGSGDLARQAVHVSNLGEQFMISTFSAGRRIVLAGLLVVLGVGAGWAAPMDVARQLNDAFIEVAERASASVVVIRVAHRPDAVHGNGEDNPFFEFLPKEFRKQFQDEMEKQRKKEKERSGGGRREPVFDGQGSGVVIREDGYILTNRHVVDGAEKIKIRFRDGKEYDGEIRGVDKKSDLAVIQIAAKGLPVLKFADSRKTRVGEFAIAIGAPFDLDYSITFGHVSAKGRSRIIPDPSMDQDFIQTDANINPGNSGGPLVNIGGEIIGINTLIRGMRTGIGFAIPANLARDIGERLISEGKYVRSWLGVAIQSLSENPEYRSLVEGVPEGVVIKEINPEGPAAGSELKPFDVVTAVDGQAVTTSQGLKNEIRGKKVGSNVVLDVNRSGKNIKVTVKPGEWPEAPEVAFRKPQRSDELENDELGLTVRTATKALADQFKVKLTEGVIVMEVETDGLAEKKGLKPGDIIKEINQKPTPNVKAFGDAVKAGDLKKGLILNLQSKGVSKFEVLREDE